MEQIPLNLEFRRAGSRGDFIISASNQMAADLVDGWPDWSGQLCALNVWGPVGCGKSHLGAVWQALTSACYLGSLDSDSLEENIDERHFLLDNVTSGPEWDEELLFLLMTRIKDAGGSLMILSHAPVSQIDWRLPDLRSRMRAITVAGIAEPDDQLLSALLEKYFVDRQLVVPETVLHYIVPRMERSFAAAARLARDIDQNALAEKRQVSLGLAREVLAKQS